MKAKKQDIVLIASAVLLALIFAAGAFYYKKQSGERLQSLAVANQEVFVPEYAPQLGNADARVQIVEFLDPECESCRAAYPQVKAILDEHPEKVKLIVRYSPLHRNSEFAIRVLEGARKQGKYWEALDLVFQTQPQWGDHHAPKPELIFTFLPQIFVDVERIKANMDDPQVAAILAQDQKDAEKLGVRGTPTFFVNGERAGMRELRGAVNREVAKQY